MNFTSLCLISSSCSDIFSPIYSFETPNAFIKSEFGKKLPSCTTEPIASSGLYGAPIFRETIMSSESPSVFAITSPVTTPPLGIAKITGCSFFIHTSFFASFWAASTLSLNIMVSLQDTVETNYQHVVPLVLVFQIPQKDEWPLVL